MDDEQQMRLDQQFCFAVYACSREITKLYHPLLKDLGITYTQYITLLALWEKDRVPVKELGRRLYLDSGTLTPLLKKLETSGYVTRSRDPNDERSVLIELTEKGRALEAQACHIPERLFAEAGVSYDEIVAVRETMKSLLRKMQERNPGEEN